MTLVGLVVLALFFAVPLLAAWLLRRLARSTALRAGAAFAAAATWAYVIAYVVGVFQLSSSTSALAFLALPFTEAAVFAVALAVGWGGAYLVHPGVRRCRRGVAPALAATAAGGLVVAVLALFLVSYQRLGDPGSDAARLRAAHRAWMRHERLGDVVAAFLAMSGNRHPLSRLALNPSAPEDVLEALARHPNGSVVWRAMSSENLGADALRRLLASDPQLAPHVIVNPNAPSDLLRALAESEPPPRALQLAGHPNLPEELRDGLFERAARSDDRYQRNAAAAQPGLPARLLRELAGDEWHLVRRTLAGNRATPLDVLRALADDEHPEVRRMAAHALARRRSPGSPADR